MKKILFVINTMGRAGAEMALLELLRVLKQKDVELSLFVLTGQGEMIEKLPEGVTLRNENYHNVSVLSPEGKKILAKSSLKALLKRGNFIRLFPYMIKNLLPMLKQRKILPDKLLWRCFSDAAPRFEEEYDLAVAYIEGGSTYYVVDHVKAKKKVAFFHVDYHMAGYTRSLDKECYLKYDAVFPISNEVKESFLQTYPECEGITQVFHNLINKDRILEMSKHEGGFTDDYDGVRILTVGRLTAQKDFAQSIEAMKLLKEQGVKARWYILGEGEQREALERLIDKMGLQEDFLLPGVVDNPYPYMLQADIYVHATRFEGKSIAIQEAQVLGCPILVSNCSGNREQVIQGVDGLICELTPQDICNGVLELLSDIEKAKAYGKEASQRHMGSHKELEKLLALIS